MQAEVWRKSGIVDSAIGRAEIYHLKTAGLPFILPEAAYNTLVRLTAGFMVSPLGMSVCRSVCRFSLFYYNSNNFLRKAIL
ncbi:MAG TPA: hypothetical protein GXX17_00005 [Clostridiales bacterium]|nr:hypothetical protein [Clostridiales bacterium]